MFFNLYYYDMGVVSHVENVSMRKKQHFEQKILLSVYTDFLIILARSNYFIFAVHIQYYISFLENQSILPAVIELVLMDFYTHT